MHPSLRSKFLLFSHSVKEHLPIALIYLSLTYINVRLKLWNTTPWFDGRLEHNHQLLMSFDYTNNEQSRLFQFLIPEFFHNIFKISVPNAYVLQRFIFLFLAFNLFHFYLKQWFDKSLALAGVFLVAAIMPVIYWPLDLQESSCLLMVTFLLTLWSIYRKNDTWFAIFMLIGAMNNETNLCLIIVYFFYNLDKHTIKNYFISFLRSISLCSPAIIFSICIRYITRNNGHLGGAWHLPDNYEGIMADLSTLKVLPFSPNYLLFITMIGVLWIYPFLIYKNANKFIKSTIILIPFFLISHLLTGVICEPRQMIPLLFVLIPASFFWLFRKEYTRT